MFGPAACARAREPARRRREREIARLILRKHQEGRRKTSSSHILTTDQPRRRSRRKFRWSRLMFSEIFSFQNAFSPRRHSSTRLPCQNAPSTKTTTLPRSIAKSGLPGRSGRCPLYRTLARRRSRAISRSHLVFFPRMRDIRSLRSAGVRKSFRFMVTRQKKTPRNENRAL